MLSSVSASRSSLASVCAICFAEIIAAVVSASNESVCSNEGAAGSGIVLNYDYVLLVAVPVGPAVVVVSGGGGSGSGGAGGGGCGCCGVAVDTIVARSLTGCGGSCCTDTAIHRSKALLLLLSLDL